MATQSVPRITEEEYLRLERAAEFKSEFINGEIFPMPGGTLRHSRLAINLSVGLARQLPADNSGLFSSDLRVRTAVSGSYVYPDISVVSGIPQIHKGSKDILTNPTVIIEVLSPSTADYDHGQKFGLYREIPSLSDYLLVHATSALIEHFVRQSDGSWSFREYCGMQSTVPIASINCAIELASLYAGVFDLPE